MELRLYNPADVNDELLLVKMWAECMQDGSIDDIFRPEMKSLAVFLTFFQSGGILGIATDDNGIFFGMFGQVLGGAMSVGLWVREDKRKSVSVGKLAKQAHAEIFKVVNSCVCYTHIPENIKLFQHFGYKPTGILHGMKDGNDIIILELLKENFNG